MSSGKAILATALVCFLISGASGYLSLASRPAGLIVEDAERDCGEVGQGETIHAAFRWRNGYNGAIGLKEILESCDCAAAEPSQKVIGPGESIDLPVTWKVGARRGQVETTV